MQMSRSEVQRLKEAIRAMAKDKSKDPDIQTLARAIEVLIS